MNCRRTQSLLSAYIDSELTGHEMLLVRKHVTYCDECSSQHQALLSVKRLLSALPSREPTADFALQLDGISSTTWLGALFGRLLPDNFFNGAGPLVTFPANHRRLVSACALSLFSLWFIVAPTAKSPRPVYTGLHKRLAAVAGFSPYMFMRWRQPAIESPAIDVIDRPVGVQDSHMQVLQLSMLRATRQRRINIITEPYYGGAMMDENTPAQGFGQPGLVYSGYSIASR